jgi:hypothetical protein
MRDGYGTMHFNMAYNADYIPAGPGPGPTRVASRRAVAETRQHRVTSHYDPDKCECVISLGFCEPEVEIAQIKSAIHFAKSRGPLRLITIAIEAEVFAQPEAYHFLVTRNKFERRESRGDGSSIVLEKRLEGR